MAEKIIGQGVEHFLNRMEIIRILDTHSAGIQNSDDRKQSIKQFDGCFCFLIRVWADGGNYGGFARILINLKVSKNIIL